MPVCDHCGKEGGRESIEYDLCLCAECWEKFKRWKSHEAEVLSQLEAQQEYWERCILPYPYSAPVSVKYKKGSLK